MSVPTVAVSVTVNDASGAAIAGAQVIATLDTVAIYGGFVVPASVTALTNASGIATLNLWPNALGTTSSRYQVVILHPVSGLRIVDATVYVPNSACNLQDILTTSYPAVEQSEAAFLAAQIAIGQIATDADAVQTIADSVNSNLMALAVSIVSTQAIVAEHHAFV